jgi:hypothetical protein
MLRVSSESGMRAVSRERCIDLRMQYSTRLNSLVALDLWLFGVDEGGRIAESVSFACVALQSGVACGKLTGCAPASFLCV